MKEWNGSESHVERAMRGPTPDNPSQSLKKRLKRAAFFDQREREAAAGLADPVDPGAGLPDSISAEATDTSSSASDQREREVAVGLADPEIRKGATSPSRAAGAASLR